MAINIGKTGSAGRFIGGGGGVFRNNQLMLFIDPFKYKAYTGETDTSFADLSGHGNDLININGTRTRTNGFWSFDGTDDFAYRADDSDFDYGTTLDFSIQMWYNNQGGTSGDFYLLSKGNHTVSKSNPSVGWSLYYDTSESKLRLRLQETTGAGESPTTDHNWGASGWQNLALVVDRSTDIKFYANGILVRTDNGSTTAQNASSTQQLIVGGAQATDGASQVQGDFNGYMGQIMIYSQKLLTQDEIRQNFNQYRGIYNV